MKLLKLLRLSVLLLVALLVGNSLAPVPVYAVVPPVANRICSLFPWQCEPTTLTFSYNGTDTVARTSEPATTEIRNKATINATLKWRAKVPPQSVCTTSSSQTTIAGNAAELTSPWKTEAPRPVAFEGGPEPVAIAVSEDTDTQFDFTLDCGEQYRRTVQVRVGFATLRIDGFQVAEGSNSIPTDRNTTHTMKATWTGVPGDLESDKQNSRCSIAKVAGVGTSATVSNQPFTAGSTDTLQGGGGGVPVTITFSAGQVTPGTKVLYRLTCTNSRLNITKTAEDEVEFGPAADASANSGRILLNRSTSAAPTINTETSYALINNLAATGLVEDSLRYRVETTATVTSCVVQVNQSAVKLANGSGQETLQPAEVNIYRTTSYALPNGTNSLQTTYSGTCTTTAGTTITLTPATLSLSRADEATTSTEPPAGYDFCIGEGS